MTKRSFPTEFLEFLDMAHEQGRTDLVAALLAEPDFPVDLKGRWNANLALMKASKPASMRVSEAALVQQARDEGAKAVELPSKTPVYGSFPPKFRDRLKNKHI